MLFLHSAAEHGRTIAFLLGVQKGMTTGLFTCQLQRDRDT